MSTFASVFVPAMVSAMSAGILITLAGLGTVLRRILETQEKTLTVLHRIAASLEETAAEARLPPRDGPG